MPHVRVVMTAVAAVACLLAAGCGGSSGEGARPTTPRRMLDPGTAVPAGGGARTTARPVVPPLHGPSGRHKAVPILMYHVVSAPPPGSAYPELWVSKERFAEEMDALRAAGYRAVTLTDVFRAWHDGGPLPPKPVVLTFDDGYTSDSTHAARVLRALRWPGVINLEVKNVGLAGGLSRLQVRRMIAGGWEVASHTVDHLDVTTLDAAGLERELAGSRRTLRRMFGVPVDFFCYPAGKYDAAAEAALRAAGYRGATTEIPGVARPGGNPMELPRIRVNGSDTAASLLAKVRAAT